MREINRELQEVYDIVCKNQGPENMDIYEHMPTLRNYASLCEHITEFGVRWVVSTWALLASKPTKMISYDLTYHPNIERAMRVALENRIDFEFRIGNTLHITIDETDLLFIDTLHTYMQLSSELGLHHSKVRKYIILHDTTTYAHHGMGPEFGGDNLPLGLADAITEFIKTHNQWRIKEVFTNNNGLMILERIS